MFFDYFSLSLKYLKHRPLRTILTVTGIAISLVLISALLILGSSLKKSVTEEFESLSPKLVFISAKSGDMLKSIMTKSLEEDDCKILEHYQYIDFCTYLRFKYAKVEYKGKSQMAAITLTNENFFKNLKKIGHSIAKGRIPKKGEVILGYLYSTDKVFGKEVKIGDKIKINDKNFKVVGFFQEVGNPQDDMNIYTLSDSFKESKNEKKVNSLVVLLKDFDKFETLKKEFNRKKGKELSYITTDAMLEQANQIIDTINYAVLVISLISLIVGSIGVSNTLFTSIYERTRDIGIMKAIGASNSAIFNMIIIETMILMFFGTLIGFIGGMGIAKIATIVSTKMGYKMPFVIELKDLLFTFGFAVILGFISALAPAKKAMELNPIDAIRQ